MSVLKALPPPSARFSAASGAPAGIRWLDLPGMTQASDARELAQVYLAAHEDTPRIHTIEHIFPTVSGGKMKGVYESLADNIGRDVYVDVNGWHLYLRDISIGQGVKLNQALAQELGPQAANISESAVDEVLKKVPLKLGGGKVTVPLSDAVPKTAVRDIKRALEDFSRS